MYKTQYTPAEAQEEFLRIDQSDHHEARKARVRRYIQARIVDPEESVEK
jgi:hypothetical protein